MGENQTQTKFVNLRRDIGFNTSNQNHDFGLNCIYLPNEDFKTMQELKNIANMNLNETPASDFFFGFLARA